MELFLKAYKTSEKLTLAKRTERILAQQRFIADELKIWTWFLSNKTPLDIRDDGCYDLIYKRIIYAKEGEPDRYQPNDVPESTSHGFFLITSNLVPVPFLVRHDMGWRDEVSRQECLGVSHMERAPELYNKSTIFGLVDTILSEYKPKELYVTSGDYLYDIAKNKPNVPWTGWITYLDNSVPLPKIKPKFCEVIQRDGGTLFQTSNEFFDDTNPGHIEKALKLEKWFIRNNVRV